MENQTFTHYNQPYGTVIFTIETDEPVLAPSSKTPSNEYLFIQAAKGYRILTGTVVEGSETSRILHHSHTKDLKDQQYKLTVPADSYTNGYHTTVAM